MDLDQEIKEEVTDSTGIPITKFQRSANRAQIVPGFIRFGLVGLVLCAEFYCIFQDVGPYNWIASLQAEIFDGSHYPTLSFLLSFILLLLPALLIIRSIIPYYERKRDANKDIIDQL